MNRRIARVAGVAMGLLVVLVAATTYWQTWARPSLADRQDNEIQRVAQFEIKRGPILDEGRVLARSRERDVAGRTLYFRSGTTFSPCCPGHAELAPRPADRWPHIDRSRASDLDVVPSGGAVIGECHEEDVRILR